MKKFTVDNNYSIQNNPLTTSKILYYIPLQEDEYLHLVFNINFNIIDKSFGYDNGLAGFNIVSNGEEITKLNEDEEYRIVVTDDGLKLLIIRVHGSVNSVNHYTNYNQLDMYCIFTIEKEVTYISADYYEVEVEDPSGLTRVVNGIRNICRAENVQTVRIKELRELENPTPIEKYILNTITTREYRLPRTVIIVDEMDYKSLLIAAVLNMMHAKNSPHKEKVYIITTDEAAGSKNDLFVIIRSDMVITTTTITEGQDIEVYDIDTAISFVNQFQANLHDIYSLDSDRVKAICDIILDRYLVKDTITRDTVTIDVICHLVGNYKNILEIFTKMIEVNCRGMDEISTDIDRNLSGYVLDNLNSVVDGVTKTIDIFKNDKVENGGMRLLDASNMIPEESYNEANTIKMVKGVVNFKIYKTYLPYMVIRILLLSIERLNLFKDDNYTLYNYTTTDDGYIYSSVVSWLNPEAVDLVRDVIGLDKFYDHVDKYLNGKLKRVSTTGDRRVYDDVEGVLSIDRFYKLSDVLNNDTDILSDSVLNNNIDED